MQPPCILRIVFRGLEGWAPLSFSISKKPSVHVCIWHYTLLSISKVDIVECLCYMITTSSEMTHCMRQYG